MKKRTIFATTLLLTLASLLFSSCDGDKWRLPIAENWEYSLTDPHESVAVFYPVEEVRALETLVPDEKGFVYIRKKFNLPPALLDRELGLYLGRVTIADETWVNGIFVGKTGRFPPKEFSSWNTVRGYTLPKGILNEGENEILIKIWCNGEGGIGYNAFIGTYDDVKHFANSQDFWFSKINLLFAFFMIIIAFYHIIIFARRPQDKENLLFALLNFVSVFYILIYFVNQIPWLPRDSTDFLLYQKVFSSGLPFIIPFLVTSFVNSFLKRKEHRLILAIRLAFMIVPLIIVFAQPDYRSLRHITSPLLIFMIPPMGYSIYVLLRRRFWKKQDEAGILLWGFSPLVFTVLIDQIIHNLLKLDSLPYLTSMGWQLVIITLLFILANRFAAARNEAEDLNANLEKKVSDRTKELSESNAQLEEAKQKADRDMQLAVHVQESFYPSHSPFVDGWDIAYHFRPMSGVSGDLYEFFQEGRTFQGLGLFDVSGHGIASGLVAMLGKVVLDRRFYAGANEPLNKVMEDINNELVESKGDIENYLTGVLMRMRGNHVEYINAGHPRVFVRTAKDGKVVPIELPDQTSSADGGLVGIAGMNPNFKVIGFALNPGDSILLYTDCLYESRNVEGMEMTQEGVLKMFSNVKAANASGKLNEVLEQFADFTKGVPLRDDLTVIVVQKK